MSETYWEIQHRGESKGVIFGCVGGGGGVTLILHCLKGSAIQSTLFIKTTTILEKITLQLLYHTFEQTLIKWIYVLDFINIVVFKYI